MSYSVTSQNWIERAIELISPAWALRRAAGHGALASYRGAVATRTSQPWGSSISYRGGSNIDRRNLATMRDRARRVYRENAIGRSLLITETDNVVAEGYTLQMGSSNSDFNREAEDRFYKWMDVADITGKHTGGELFRMSWMQPRKDGDGGFILARRGGYPRLQYISGDLIRDPWGMSGTSRSQYNYQSTFDGIECDPTGRPLKFWVRDVDEQGKDSATPIDARDFRYVAFLDDPGAIRGATVYGPIFELLDQIDTYRDSVTKASIMACIFGLIEKRRNPGAVMSGLGTMANSQGDQQKAVTLENGMIKVLGSDEGVVQVQASQPMQQTPDFMRALSRVAAIGFDMPLEVALRDLSQVNFSGGQLGMKGYERTCRVRQDWHKATCWNPITFWWLSVERKRQELGYQDAFKTPFPADYGNFELHAREWLLRDRLGEAKADLMEIAIGKSCPQKVCAQSGSDYADNLKNRKQAWDDNAAAGLPNVLPTDTRDSVEVKGKP